MCVSQATRALTCPPLDHLCHRATHRQTGQGDTLHPHSLIPFHWISSSFTYKWFLLVLLLLKKKKVWSSEPIPEGSIIWTPLLCSLFLTWYPHIMGIKAGLSGSSPHPPPWVWRITSRAFYKSTLEQVQKVLFLSPSISWFDLAGLVSSQAVTWCASCTTRWPEERPPGPHSGSSAIELFSSHTHQTYISCICEQVFGN